MKCQLSKHVRNSYPISNNKSYVSFSIVHSDVWGSSPTTSLFGFRYFVNFVDDCSRCMWVYLMKTKGEVGVIFQTFHKMIQTQFETSIKILRSDNGGSIYFIPCKNIWLSMALSIKHLVLAFHNKME